jgi:Sulfotransferase domain
MSGADTSDLPGEDPATPPSSARVVENPDFVIAGAAKSGTTALYDYLCRHPAVFMPSEKEPGFFSTDVPGGVGTLEEYRALFAAAPAHCMTGEASTRYLYSHVAIPRLLAHNPDVKVVVILRNPVDAAYSMHGYTYRYGIEDIADFEHAWRAQQARFASEKRTSTEIYEYDYRTVFRYGEQVRRVLNHVPARQRHFMVYEEFFSDPVRHYGDLLEFLGLAPAPPPAFPVVNGYLGVRSPTVERLLRRPPTLIKLLYAPLRPLIKAAGLRPGLLVKRMNWGRQQKQALRPEFRAELESYFSDDVAEVERLLGRTLWSGRR